MGHRDRRRYPLKPVLLQRQRTQKWRAHRHGIDGRTDVVNKTRERDFRGSHSPAWARHMAAASPLGPEPTTMASVLGSSWLGVRFLAELLAGLLASFMAGSR